MENKMTFEQFCNPAFRRQEQVTVKSEAVWASFIELDGLINFSRLAKRYFGKSQRWFAQKLHGNSVDGKERKFTHEEYKQLSAAFSDIASKLEAYANCIDKATD